MGELARRRSARDLWISRSHLWAAAAGALLLAITAFSFGIVVGGGESAHASRAPLGSLDAAPDDSLVELLARVDASADPSGGVAGLTFPGALSGEAESSGVPQPPREFRGVAVVEAAPVAMGPVADNPPPGRFAVTVLRSGNGKRAIALRDQLGARGLPAWTGAEMQGGSMMYRVALGGFLTEAEAVVALDGYRARVVDLPLLAGATVEPIR
ncbi:MAG: SPOR domain-containing protein [Deltaproteobacteria bacterium]|nr:SPOR domain-containing protein [Deltaproteobacteria bacterium]